jgi:hypothetical protein
MWDKPTFLLLKQVLYYFKLTQMKKVIILSMACLFMLSSCNKGGGFVCTSEYRMVLVRVQNAAKTGVTLDEVYTIRQSTGEKLTFNQGMGGGAYNVIDDSYQARLSGKTENFTFVGIRAGQKVVEEPYRISADRCHISKVSGRDEVEVN